MKFLLTFCFIAALGTFAQGERIPRSDFVNVLYREEVVRPAIPDKVQSVVVKYSGSEIIGNVNVNDHIANKMGAKPQLMAGGPGSTYVKIALIGKMDCGINSTVVIYGLFD